MRILFVDDEPRVLSGIENSLLFAPDGWEADFAHSGEDAVALLDAGRYDMLVTDMQMPGLTGADVLERARCQAPHMVRIILSGEVETALAERAMPLAHEFVSKPCAPETLFAIIERVYNVSRSIIESGSGDLLASLDSLPSKPTLHDEIQACLDQGEGIDAIARIVESDLALASSIIKTANSAFYGFRSPAETIRDAAVRLGAVTISGLVLNAEIGRWAGLADVPELNRLNSHAAFVADAVHHLIGREVKQARLAGFLHDIGRLVILARFPDQFHAIGVGAEDEGEEEALSVEPALIGMTHGELGAHMLELWKLDSIVVEAVRCHHQPELATGDARRIVDAITVLGLVDRQPDEFPDTVDRHLLTRARDYMRLRVQ